MQSVVDVCYLIVMVEVFESLDQGLDDFYMDQFDIDGWLGVLMMVDVIVGWVKM